jgi:hypothetical protein
VTRLIIALVVGVILGVAAVAGTSALLSNAANGTPSNASLYGTAYGSR